MNAFRHPKAKTYCWIFGWLVVLTFLEVTGAQMDIPKTALAIFLVSTALAKASLIALYFMHLRFENGLVWLLPAVPVFLAFVFVVALFPDIVFHLTLKM